MARVLLVDDELVVRRVLARVLALAGHEVVQAADVAEALAPALLKGAPIDVAILDKNLPDGSGIELARMLRARHPDLPVVMLSGYASDSAVRDAMAAGCLDFLRKPLEDLGELDDAIARAIAARAAGHTRQAVGTPGGPVVLYDPGARGDALAAALAARRRRVVRAASVDEAAAALRAGGVAAALVAGETRAPVMAIAAAARDARPAVPVTVVASRGAIEEEVAALRAGAHGYVVDPSPEELAGRLA